MLFGSSELVGTADFLQRGFLKLEEEGKVYRFSPEILPTKFKDATLCERELGLLRRFLVGVEVHDALEVDHPPEVQLDELAAEAEAACSTLMSSSSCSCCLRASA